MKRNLSLLIILLFISCNQLKKETSIFNFSLENLSKIDSYSSKLVENNELPGIVVMVKRGDKLVYHKAFGYSDIEKKIEIDKNAIFRIASITKTITALGILKLMEDGKINLEDELSKYIPEFNNLRVYTGIDSLSNFYMTKPSESKITIRDLLQHRSGLSYGPYTSNHYYSDMYIQFFKDSLVNLYTTKNVTLKSNVKKIAKIPLVNEPKKLFSYSWSYDVLGRVIEIVSQKSLNTFFNETFFIPLEMKNTFFYIPEEKSDFLIPVLTNQNGYWSNYKSIEYDINYPIVGSKTYFSGGAGLSGTISDYSNFLTMIVNKGRFKQSRILKEKTILLIHEIPSENKIGDGYHESVKEFGHGIASGIRVIKKKNEDGVFKENPLLFWSGMFGCSYFIYPKDKTIGLMFKQVYNLKDIENYDYTFQTIILDSSVN